MHERRTDESPEDYEERLYRNRVSYGLSWDDIGTLLNLDQHPDNIRKASYGYLKRCDQNRGNAKPRPRLVFGDVHIPYQLDGWLEFLQGVHKKYNCHDEVICLGDIVDNHAISRHQTHPEAISGLSEFDQAQIEINKLLKVFPKGKICLGNHDQIPQRQVATLGINNKFLKSFAELWSLDKYEWDVAIEHIVDDVLYAHGLNCSGVSGSINKAMRDGISTCIGHYHSNGSVHYFNNGRTTIFGANAGCLCDPDSLAMEYGQYSRLKPTIGCLIVYDNKRADFIPFYKI